MSEVEKVYGVWLYQRRIGSITLNGGIIRFQLDDDYIHDPNHAVLGLIFEDDLEAIHRSKKSVATMVFEPPARRSTAALDS